MIRILWFFILTVVMYWALKELFSKSGRKDRRFDKAGEEMVRDPNCGVYLPISSAISFQKGRKRLYFCSEACREKYKNRTKHAD